jgi:hypothetical protein
MREKLACPSLGKRFAPPPEVEREAPIVTSASAISGGVHDRQSAVAEIEGHLSVVEELIAHLSKSLTEAHEANRRAKDTSYAVMLAQAAPHADELLGFAFWRREVLTRLRSEICSSVHDSVATDIAAEARRFAKLKLSLLPAVDRERFEGWKRFGSTCEREPLVPPNGAAEQPEVALTADVVLDRFGFDPGSASPTLTKLFAMLAHVGEEDLSHVEGRRHESLARWDQWKILDVARFLRDALPLPAKRDEIRFLFRLLALPDLAESYPFEIASARRRSLSEIARHVHLLLPPLRKGISEEPFVSSFCFLQARAQEGDPHAAVELESILRVARRV